MDSTADPGFRFSALERWVLELLAVPAAPEPPDGSAESIRVFHAGSNYYKWSVLVWAIGNGAGGAGLIVGTVVSILIAWKVPGWIQLVWASLAIVAWVIFGLTTMITFLSRRLDYRLRWYIVTDRSLRIRSGVFNVNELTMTYGNIQEIRVSAGPLQHLLGLADVEVHSAGGGGEKHNDGGHVGRFEGLSNANDIRDLIDDRVRRYRDSGLGEMPRQIVSSDPSEIAAARAMLEEVRALRASLR